MRSAVWHGLFAGLFLLISAAPAEAAKRVALVVGNDAYESLPKLEKAVNDARAVGAALTEIGFDVISGENLSRRDMNRKLADLEKSIEPGDQVFFYYAGHGVAIGGDNVLLSIDMPSPQSGEEELVREEGFAVDSIVKRVQKRGAEIAILVLDACRNNPFEAGGTREIGATRGLTKIDAPTGVFVLFSAGIGQTALDRLPNDNDKNSVFTRRLVPALKTPGLTHVGIAKRVQREVGALAATIQHKQQPAYYDQIDGEIVLNGTAAVAPVDTDVATLAEQVKKLQDELTNQNKDGQKVAIVAPTAPATSAGCDDILVKVGADEECLKPGDTFRDCDGCPEMVVVPPGTFTMGSPKSEEGRKNDEGPQHEVKIAKPFAVGRFEVTRGQFMTFVEATGHKPRESCWLYVGKKWKDAGLNWRDPGYVQSEEHPVVCVSWEDTKDYLVWLSKQTGQRYRLLTEAEWEFANRGRTTPGTYPRYHFGDAESELCTYANGADQSVSLDWQNTSCSDQVGEATAPTGRYKPNPFGLYDMHGNVWEWVEDCYRENYKKATKDGSATSSRNCDRVIRGGSWLDELVDLRSASRYGTSESYHLNYLGFRVARALGQ